ncbi:peroxidase family protein [Allorhizocola rhizosphaerae]|uniref:peroxidase family protein n=1 Tax=Allorhizocola rhizosphaerae TaxID=1872709 RepID=UPI001FE60B47|nr:peroxidase family protein [Allorhizocola rhizosphaerae]
MKSNRRLSIALSLLLGLPLVIVGNSPATAAVPFEIQSLNGSGNNRANPTWGQADLPYSRVTAARYADGRSQPVTGPNSRAVSNRVFNDVAQNLFSERNVTQWGFTWGQFLDHTFGLRLGRAPGDPAGEAMNIPFNANDPLEEFENTLGFIPFVRSTAADGTGVNNPRQQVNTVSSYVDAAAVYGPDTTRLTWLRDSARMFLPGGYLPRRDSRGDPSAAPVMEVDGLLRATPNRAAVAGDVRANENIALTATHTLFAREHNRIVNLLPSTLSAEDRFQIARRVVIAEQQYITYHEFLPALGVHLAPYTGYRSNVDATLSNEFATVGYRAHSMIHGEIELETEVARYSQATLDSFEAQGLELAIDGDDIEIAVPLNVAFFNPNLVEQLQLGPLLQGIGLEAQYSNDEQIDNQLRSVLFQVPVPGNPECLDGPTLPECFRGVVDLGAIDIERGRDHGMPSYNQLRQAYGLSAKTSFTAITGEATDQFPAGSGIDNPNSLDFLQLFNFGGDPVELGSPEAESDPTRGVRRATIAAKLRAIYGNVNNIDAFTGMIAEQHLPGADMGELQLAIWKREFERLRDGDRFFFANDPGLSSIRSTYGIDFRRNLGDIIALNTDIPREELNGNVFLVSDAPSARCEVDFGFTTVWNGGYQVIATVTNLTGNTVNGWTLRWKNPSGQSVTLLWDGVVSQSGPNVTVTNPPGYNQSISPGGTRQFGFNGSWDNAVNPEPASFTLNNMPCFVIT